MARKSTKENKTPYQISREDAGLTREKASEKLIFISADRIEKIESEKYLPHPEEILAMSDAYKNPSLNNFYCSHICPIGQHYVPEIEIKDLSQIVLQMLATLNTVDRQKTRLIDITADGKITKDEMSDFANIKNTLDKVSITIDSLRLWIETELANGNIDKVAWDEN